MENVSGAKRGMVLTYFKSGASSLHLGRSFFLKKNSHYGREVKEFFIRLVLLLDIQDKCTKFKMCT